MQLIRKKRKPITKYVLLAALFTLAIIIYKNPLDSLYNGDKQNQTTATFTPAKHRKERLALTEKLIATQNYKEAINICRDLLHPDKEFAQIHLQLGLSYMKQKKLAAAARHMRNALEINPNLLSPHLYLGKILSKQGDHQKAAIHCLKVIKKRPDNFDAHLRMGLALMNMNKYEAALKHNQIALKLNPNNVHGWLNTGHVHNKLGNMNKAIQMYRHATTLAPKLANAHYNLGYTLKLKGELESALKSLNKALELKPDYLDAHIARAQIYWGLNDYQQAEQDYRWRWQLFGLNHQKIEDKMWNGSDDLNGKRVLLLCEQGLGDTVQFVRYAQHIKERGATVICKVQKPLAQLLSSCPFIDKIVTDFPEKTSYDIQAALMGLPGLLKTTAKTIPANIPYISASSELVDLWGKRLARDTGLKVGLCWHVQNEHEHLKCPSALRSVDLKLFEPLTKVDGVQFYCLQKMSNIDLLKNKPTNLKLKTFGLEFDETHGRFMDTAAVIQNLDLVVTVDTSVAHVAAALGKPVWMLLPYSPDCRWGVEKTDTAWYPTMRLFRQQQPGDFKTVLKQVALELEKASKTPDNQIIT